MKVVFSDTQRAHDPQMFLSSGAPKRCPEKPARIEALLSGVRKLDLPVIAPGDAGMAPIAAVHPARYLTFLKNIHDRWRLIEGASPEVIPNIHPGSRLDGYPKSAVGQAGFHMTDTSCPISGPTWGSAYASAQTAIHGAGLLCLTLHAEIAPVTPDEYEDGEMEFLTLTCDGKDASFLFTSDVLTEMICEAAWGAFEVWATNQQRLYEEDRAADRAADRAFEREFM